MPFFNIKPSVSGFGYRRFLFFFVRLRGSDSGVLRFALRLNADETASFLTLGEYHCTFNESVESVILTHAYIQTGMMHGSALTFDDIACLGVLTAKNLHSESFAF